MKHTKKKRVLALVLCMVLVLSTAVAAFANEDVTLTKVSLPGTTLMQTITNADGEEITVTAEVPTGAFTANTSNADITMEVKTVSDESAVLDLVEKKMQGDSDSEYQIENYEMQEVTFYVNNVEQIPEQPITFHVRGTSLDTENVIAFADDTSNEPTMMSTSVDSNSGIQFTAEVSNAESIIYGVFEKAKEVAYEQTYSDDQVEIKVTAASGVLPENATLQVTPVVKTEVTDQMTAEEKQSAEEINAKYETTEQKLNEKATSESYNIAGFLAYDISFTDGDGNKIEPTGDVNVSMSYKEATIADEAVQTVENTESLDSTADLDVSVIHLEENEQGEVQDAVDLSNEDVTSGSIKKLETDDEKKVEKVEFVSDSFSTFVITWKKNDSYGTNLVLKYVDTNGNEINAGQENGTIESGSTESIELKDYAKDISNYSYSEARLNSSDGEAITYVRLKPLEDGETWNEERTPQVSSDGINWTDVDKSSVIYLVYSSNSSSSDVSNLEVAHQKYIKKNDDGNYDLTLNVAGEVESQTVQAKVDVMLIVDTSGSMSFSDNGDQYVEEEQQRIYKLKKAISGLVTKFEDRNIDAKYNLVTFGSNAKNQSGGEWMDGTALTKIVNDLRADGGTNYDQAFRYTTTPLTKARNDAEKIVIFLTDGQPTFYGDNVPSNNRDKTMYGLGDATDEKTLTAALESAEKINCDKFYAVGFNLQTISKTSSVTVKNNKEGKIYKYTTSMSNWIKEAVWSFSDMKVNGKTEDINGLDILKDVAGKVTANTSKDACSLSRVDELSALFDDIVNSSLTFACSNVTIVDTLSDYVQPTSTSALNVKVMEKITDSSGNVTYTQIASKTGKAMGDESSIPSTTVMLDGSRIIASYDGSGRKITLDFPDDYNLKENYYYYVTITNLEPTEKAYSEYKSSGYNAAGDKLTDASSDGNYAVSDGISSEQSGFYSNSEAKVTYTYKSSQKIADYANPVIQVTDSSIIKSKSAQVADWDKRTYNITLNVSSTSTAVTTADPVEVVLVLDTSNSMHFRSSVTAYKNCTLKNLFTDGEGPYYFIESNNTAKMYRVWRESQSGSYSGYPWTYWKYYCIDDSSWDYTNNAPKSGKSSTYLGSYNENNREQIETSDTSVLNLKSGTYQFYTDNGIVNKISYDRLYYLQKAANEFISNLAEISPQSKIGLVTFDETATTDLGLTELDSSGVTKLKNAISGIETASGTKQNLGLDNAKTLLESSTSSLKKYVILLTDGCPNGVDYNTVTASVNGLKGIASDPTLMTISVGMTDNDALNTAKNYLAKWADADSKETKYANNADNAEQLTGVFRSILKSISQKVEVQNAEIKDYIDERFELTKDEIERLEKDGAEVGTETVNGKKLQYVKWSNQTIAEKTTGENGKEIPGWTKTFQVKAKDTFIGGNAITTNGSGSGVTIDGHLSEFEQPTVNVKSNIVLADKEVTIFKGDNVPTDNNILNQLFGENETTSYGSGKVGKADYSKMTVTWYKNKECTEEITKEKMKAVAPEETTHYYVKVTFDAGKPTEDSNANTTVIGSDGRENVKIDGAATTTGASDGATTYIYTAKKSDGTDHGTYTVNVITGEIQIKKYLTATKNFESFTFVLKRQETDSEGHTTETVYPLVQNDDGSYRPAKNGETSVGEMNLAVSKQDDNSSTLTGTITIKDLPRGVYTVSESDKTDYDIQTTEIGSNTNCYSNKDENNNVPNDVASFTIGNGTTNENVIVEGQKNGSLTYYHDTTNSYGQLGVVIFTNEPVVSDWMIQKVSTSSSDLKLAGAKFELTEATASGDQAVTYYGKSSETGNVIWYTDQDRTSAYITDRIPAGTYTLKETKAPAGYTVSTETWTITLSKNGSIKTIKSSAGHDIVAVEVAASEQKDGITTTKTISYYQFADTAVYELPSSGGSGIFLFMIGGMLLMGGAGLIMCRSKRREVLKR